MEWLLIPLVAVIAVAGILYLRRRRGDPPPMMRFGGGGGRGRR